jgi:hypothetical protein
MAKKHFPRIVYGRDSYRGRRGPDDPSPGSAFAAATDSLGNGYELELFRGQYLERLSIVEILDREAGEQEALEHNLDQELLSRYGFGTDGSTLTD